MSVVWDLASSKILLKITRYVYGIVESYLRLIEKVVYNFPQLQPHGRILQLIKMLFSETIPWCTAVSDSLLLLGHGDGSTNLVNWRNGQIITVQQQNSGILLLRFINQTLLLLTFFRFLPFIRSPCQTSDTQYCLSCIRF